MMYMKALQNLNKKKQSIMQIHKQILILCLYRTLRMGSYNNNS